MPSLPDSQRTPPEQSAQLPKIPVDAAFLRRCLADPRASGRTRFASRMAGFVALHLSRRSGADEGEDAPQAGLSVSHHLGCDRPRSRQRAAGRMGGCRQSSRCLGVWRGRSQQRHGRHAGIGAWHRRAAEVRLEAEAHDRDRELGRRRRRTDRFHGMGRAARSRTGERRRLFQRGRSGIRPKVRRVVGAHPQAVYPRRDQGCAQPERRHACTTNGKRAASPGPTASAGPRRTLATPSAFRPRQATPMCRSETWAAARTTPSSCSTWACLRRT